MRQLDRNSGPQKNLKLQKLKFKQPAVRTKKGSGRSAVIGVATLALLLLLPQGLSAQNTPPPAAKEAANFSNEKETTPPKPEQQEKMQAPEQNQVRAEDQDPMGNIDKQLKALDHLFIPIHWSDPVTGLAIGGYDPVTYFSAAPKRIESEDHEYVWRGVSWRFQSEGNWRAFKRSPSLYAPVFAGYDAYALSNGVLSQGLPSIWEIREGRLYLFHNPVNRHLWREHHKSLKDKVSKNWQRLSLELPRTKLAN